MTSREDIVKALKQVPAVVCDYGKVLPPSLACSACLQSVLALCTIAWPNSLCHADVFFAHLWLSCTQPVVHYTFIPLIIILGCTCTEPRPTLAQLLGPM